MNEKCKSCLRAEYALTGKNRCKSAECRAKMEREESVHKPPTPCLHKESITPIDGKAGCVTDQLELPFVPP